MILRRLPVLRLPLLLALATPVLLSACWLPPKEVIKEKAAARKAWRAQEKQRKQVRKEVPKQVARVVAEGRRMTPTQNPMVEAKASPTLSVTLPDKDSAPVLGTRPPLPVTAKPVAPVEASALPQSTAPAPVVVEKPAKRKKGKDAPAVPSRQMAQLTPIEGVANMVAITRPSSPLAVSAPWQDGASPAQLTRIDGWIAQFESDKAAVVAGGQGVDIAKQGRLFETDAAMLYGMIPPGLYDCRLVQINAAGTLWHEGKSGKCRVLTVGENRRISFITTAEVILGDLHENDGFSSVYLGQGMAANMGALGAVAGPEIGLIQRIADTRWRIILPMEAGGGSAVVDITRPRLAE